MVFMVLKRMIDCLDSIDSTLKIDRLNVYKFNFENYFKVSVV